jgi:hypothetical protein
MNALLVSVIVKVVLVHFEHGNHLDTVQGCYTGTQYHEQWHCSTELAENIFLLSDIGTNPFCVFIG